MSIGSRSPTAGNEIVIQFREAQLMRGLDPDDSPVCFELKPLGSCENEGSLEEILHKKVEEIDLRRLVNVLSRLAILNAQLEEGELEDLRKKIAYIPRNSVTPEVKLFCEMHSIPEPGTLRGPSLGGSFKL